MSSSRASKPPSTRTQASRGPATIVGEHVEVLHVSQANGRRELIATRQRAGRRYDIALLDIDIHADAPTSRLLAAYRRWLLAG
jgi:hypothetical protein